MSEVLARLLEITDGAAGDATGPARRILREAATREVYELASNVASTMGQLESDLKNMPKLTKAIAKARQEIISAINADESWLMRKLGFKDKNQSLSNAIIEAEMLRLAALNAMDSVKLTIIKDFNKATRLDDSEIIKWTATPITGGASRGAVSQPRRAPFSEIAGLDYEIYSAPGSMMVIGPKPTGALNDISFSAPGWPAGGLTLFDVPFGNFYLTRVDDDGDPSPLLKTDKTATLAIRDTTPAELGKTISSLVAAEKRSRGRGSTLDLQQIISDHFKVPTDEQGFIETLARKIFSRPRIGSFDRFYKSADMYSDVRSLTLNDFKKNYVMLKDKTLPGSGDRPIDEIDAVVAGGLTSLAVALGMRPPAPPPASPGSPAASGGSASAGSSGAAGAPAPGGPGGVSPGRTSRATPMNRSLRNFLQNNVEIVKGADSAEKQRNLQTLLNTLDTDGLRRELNRAVGPTVVFTEGNIDRWRELAGIPKERLND